MAEQPLPTCLVMICPLYPLDFPLFAVCCRNLFQLTPFLVYSFCAPSFPFPSLASFVSGLRHIRRIKLVDISALTSMRSHSIFFSIVYSPPRSSCILKLPPSRVQSSIVNSRSASSSILFEQAARHQTLHKVSKSVPSIT